MTESNGLTTITEFLLARIAEEVEVARRALGEPSYGDRYGDTAAEEIVRLARSEGCRKAGVKHFQQWMPARVLAECQVKRQIVTAFEIARERRDAYRSRLALGADDENAARDRCLQEARSRVAEDAVRALAAIYAGHPDYQPAWYAQ